MNDRFIGFGGKGLYTCVPIFLSNRLHCSGDCRIPIIDIASFCQAKSWKLMWLVIGLRRTFQKELGVGPKELLDIIRFQSLLRERYKRTQSSFTDIAVKFGYYDQPHFIHHFKRYYGLAPNQVFK